MSFVSCIIPTHNRPEMLIEALASVRAQTFTDYEIIVVSNGEGNEMRAASLAIATYFDAVYVALAEGNVSRARNFGIAQAKGEWIAFLDDDDIWLPTKLERQVAAAGRTGADMIAADWIEFHPDGRERISRPRCPDGWPYAKAIHHGYWRAAMGSSPLIRKAVFDEIGGFDISLRIAEDIDMVRRIGWRHTIHQMDEVLMRYRRGHASLSRDIRQLAACDLRHFRKMRRDTPAALRWTLPSAMLYVPPRFILLLLPTWCQDMIGALRPRRRWVEFRRWLRLRTR